MKPDSSAGCTVKGVTGNGRLAFTSSPNTLWTSVGSWSGTGDSIFASINAPNEIAFAVAGSWFAFISTGCTLEGTSRLSSTFINSRCLSLACRRAAVLEVFSLTTFLKLEGAGILRWWSAATGSCRFFFADCSDSTVWLEHPMFIAFPLFFAFLTLHEVERPTAWVVTSLSGQTCLEHSTPTSLPLSFLALSTLEVKRLIVWSWVDNFFSAHTLLEQQTLRASSLLFFLLSTHKEERLIAPAGPSALFSECTATRAQWTIALFSFIIMPRNSQVRGLCNPVVYSSLLNSMLNYHVLCFLT